VTETLSAGWAALKEGRWQAARDAFEQAVADETAEAYEGLSWAAWWLDDADSLFPARERAYRAYRACGDAPNAVRMAAWLAADELDFHGAPAVASGWLLRARRLLDGLEPGPERGWLTFFDGYLAYDSGDVVRAGELGAETAELGRRFGVPDLEMLGLALEGATLVARADVDGGMARLDEATAAALADEATVPISGAWACCFLVTSCVAVLDFERAVAWCDRIAAFAERYGSRYMLAFCRAEYGAVHLWQGRWVEAERVLEASIKDYSRSRPAMLGGPLVALAELRRRQGRSEEAVLLLDRAGASRAAQLCRARLLLDDGAATDAAELLERLLRGLPAERRLDRVPVVEVLVSARIAEGDLEAARAPLAELRDVAALVGTETLRACADLAEGRLALAEGDAPRARTLFEDAQDVFTRAGARFEAAVTQLELARCLEALGRSEAGEDLARSAHSALVELGAGAREPEPPLPELTAREREVLGLLAEGLTNQQIGERLVVSEHTVHRHVTSILRKLEVPSRAAAAAQAVRSGLS
jgi:LuxR family transcriptional regulator, maltose regulon positive regulatory protein